MRGNWRLRQLCAKPIHIRLVSFTLAGVQRDEGLSGAGVLSHFRAYPVVKPLLFVCGMFGVRRITAIAP
jgi:hypothetical protein